MVANTPLDAIVHSWDGLTNAARPVSWDPFKGISPRAVLEKMGFTDFQR